MAVETQWAHSLWDYLSNNDLVSITLRIREDYSYLILSIYITVLHFCSHGDNSVTVFLCEFDCFPNCRSFCSWFVENRFLGLSKCGENVDKTSHHFTPTDNISVSGVYGIYQDKWSVSVTRTGLESKQIKCLDIWSNYCTNLHQTVKRSWSESINSKDLFHTCKYEQNQIIFMQSQIQFSYYEL